MLNEIILYGLILLLVSCGGLEHQLLTEMGLHICENVELSKEAENIDVEYEKDAVKSCKSKGVTAIQKCKGLGGTERSRQLKILLNRAAFLGGDTLYVERPDEEIVGAEVFQCK